jgi:hypothetical protein
MSRCRSGGSSRPWIDRRPIAWRDVEVVDLVEELRVDRPDEIIPFIPAPDEPDLRVGAVRAHLGDGIAEGGPCS